MRFYLFGPRIWGIRPGISFQPSDLRSHKPPKAANYIYVITGDEHAFVKIGVTKNPDARLAQIQTGASCKLDYAFIAPTSGDPFSIEKEAHAMLERNRVNGEWFNVPPELAIAAVTGAAAKLGQSLTAKHDQHSPPAWYLPLFLFGMVGYAFLVWRIYVWFWSLPVN
jgi:hypothetical protein